MAFGIIRDPSAEGSYISALACAAFLIITWPFVILRLCVRLIVSVRYGLDDLFLVFTQIAYTGFCVTTIVSHQKAPGIRAHSLQAAEQAINLGLAAGAFYALSQMFLKLTLGFFFLRILSRRWERIACQVLIVISTAYNLMYFFYTVFNCGADAKNYGKKTIQGLCSYNNIPTEGLLYTQAGINVLVDLGYACLPLPAVFAHPSLAARARISVLLLFCLAIGGTAASIARMFYLKTIISSNFKSGSQGNILSNVEIGVFIICLCLVSLRPLLGKITGSTKASQSQGTSTTIKSGRQQNSVSELIPENQNSIDETLGSNREKSKDMNGGSITE